MMSITKLSPKTLVQTQKSNNNFHGLQKAYLLKEVIEGLQDGILILTETGELIHANTSAYHIISQINQSSSQSKCVPSVIWTFCESLLESRNLFPNQNIILSHELAVDKSTIFRVRVRWLYLSHFNRSCLLVTIENLYESLKNVALAEVKKYELTPREAEIWCLYRARLSYKEIAAKLYITINTVKKHMKNIHAKRQAFINCEV